MCSDVVVQHDDGTPTGSRSTSFLICGILGPDVWSIFMRWLRRLAERFSVAASLVGHPGDGTRYASWEVYGKTQEAVAKDEAFAKLWAHTATFAQLTGRNISVGVDL